MSRGLHPCYPMQLLRPLCPCKGAISSAFCSICGRGIAASVLLGQLPARRCRNCPSSCRCPEEAALPLQGRNRRCLTLDLRQEAGRDICRQLADRADVLVENFRPGVMEKWGLGPKVSGWCTGCSCLAAVLAASWLEDAALAHSMLRGTTLCISVHQVLVLRSDCCFKQVLAKERPQSWPSGV